MTKLRFIAALLLLSFAVYNAKGQGGKITIEGTGVNNAVEVDLTTGMMTATNGVIIQNGTEVMTAERASVNQTTGEAIAEGNVRILREDMVWVGDRVRYNFNTREIHTDLFRAGKSPLFVAADSVTGGGTNKNAPYTAIGGYVTTDDISRPVTRIRAKSITIIPNERIIARHATLYVNGFPVFYFPYYSRRFDERENNFTFVPGYRTAFGPFLLTTYSWYLNEKIDGAIHADYREQRGVGAGPDLNLHLGRWGEASMSYYYLHDDDPLADANGLLIDEDRHYARFAYDAMPWTNLTLKAQVNYESDPLVRHDFFESEYRLNPQPKTFVEVNKVWDNFSLDVYAQGQINDFFETVEHLPEVKITGFRQRIGESPLYYESESSAGYYRRRFAESNSIPTGLDFEAARADTYHQVTLPQTFFNWLNVTPRVGGRFTYYSRAEGQGAATEEQYRGVFNTGAEVTFKASRTWAGATNRVLDVNGMRHIIQPSANYVYVPKPDDRPSDLPQFSYESPSLRLLPIEYPDYNAIDSIDSQNVVRFGLNNKLQTRRDGEIQDLLRWDIYTDWRLRPRPEQDTFADIWSDLLFRPRTWLTLESQLRYDVDDEDLRSSFVNLTFQPNDVWSWSIGHWYLLDDFSGTPTSLGQGNSLVTSSLFYRLNENYAFRLRHYYEVDQGRLQEQYYTIYRDFRSWVGALSFRVRDDGREKDYAVAFTFSLKALPRYKVGSDTVRPYQLIGN